MAKSQGRTVAQSAVEMVEVVLPNDANPLGNMLGGKVMHLIDIAGAVAAHRHARSQVVTVAVDNLDFLYPIRVGELIVLRAHITRAFRTSMEAEVRVYLEDYLTGERRQTSSARLRARFREAQPSISGLAVAPNGLRPSVRRGGR